MIAYNMTKTVLLNLIFHFALAWTVICLSLKVISVIIGVLL